MTQKPDRKNNRPPTRRRKERASPSPPGRSASKCLAFDSEPRLAPLEAVLTGIDDGLLVLDKDWRCAYVNKTAAAFLGSTPQELIGKVVWEALPQTRDSRFYEESTRAVEQEVFVGFEEYHEPLGRWYECRCYPGDGGLTVLLHDTTGHKLIEEAVAESRQVLEMAIAGSRAGVWRLDLNPEKPGVLPDYMYLSPQLKALIGFADHELANSRSAWFSRILSEDVPRIEESARAHAEGRTEYHQVDFRIRHKDGSIRWLSTRGRLYRDEFGRPIRWAGIDWDITDRKQAEEEATRAREEWERTFDAVPDLIAIIDPQYCILRANRAMAQRLGMAPEQCAGSKCYVCFHGLNGPPDFCPHTQTLADGREHTAEVYEEHLGGYFLITCTPLFDPQGRLLGSVHVARDITERKHTDQVLREEKAISETTIESLPGVFYLFDSQGRYLKWNRNLERVSGYTAEEISRMHPLDFFTGRDRELIEQRIQEVFTEGRSSAEAHLVTKDGRKIPYFFTGLATTIGDTHCLIGTGIDITERKRAEDALRAGEERYRRFFEQDLAGDFVATPQGKVLECNPAFAEIYGFAGPRQAGGHDISQFNPADWADLVTRLRNECQVKEYRSLHRRPDGREISVIANVVGRFDEAAELTEVQGYIFDETERKQAEDYLRRYQLLSDNSRDIILFMRRDDGRILEANAAALQAYGYSREELLARTVHDLRAPGTQDATLGQMARADTRGILFETVHQRKDGSTFPVEVSSQGATIGEIRTLVSVIRDITERQQAEEALRESEHRFKTSFENAAVGIAHVGLDGRLLRFNDRFCRIAGYTRDELSDRTWRDITRPHDWEIEQGCIQRLLAGAVEHYSIEKQFLRADSSLIWVNLTRSVQRNSAGEPQYFIAVVQDISDRKKIEEALRQVNEHLEEEVQTRTEELQDSVDRLHAEVARRVVVEGMLRQRSEMLETFFQHTITPLVFLNWCFDFVRVNEAFAEAAGKDPGFFTSKNFFALYPDEEHKAIFERVVRTGQPYQAYAKPFQFASNPQRDATYWNWWLTPLLDEHGQVESLVLNLEDVTERQKAFSELEERARQLQELTLELTQTEDRERKRLAEVLHDDLQQMLAAAKFHLGLLSSRVKTDDTLHELAGEIKEMLQEAINKSRSLSHELRPPGLSHSDLYETLEWLAQQMQAKHGLTVHLDACERIELRSEPLKAFLYKAAQEMLFNAIKHAQVKEAQLRLRRRRGCIYLSVSDRGRGFDRQKLGRAGGFGLLSIRERVKLLGGRMKIRSIPGQGSVFLIAVPEPQPAREGELATEEITFESATWKTRPKSPEGRALRVLLVDDHKIVREGLESMLVEERDIEIIGQAGNGREAIDLAHELQPDVVVMDVAMPVMGGDEATRQIKQHLPDTRVVALSMFDDARIAERMRRAGAATYLLKTAPSEELLAAIRGA